VVVRLGTAGAIERAIVDTLHFHGNAPDACALDVARVAPDASGRIADPDGASDDAWRPLLGETKLQPHTAHVFEAELAAAAGEATHVRLRIWPDGGVSRLRLFGIASDAGRERAGMRALRAMPDPELRAALLSCCGSTAWAAGIMTARPFDSLDVLKRRAGEIWLALAPKEWDEAFRAHPRIGEKKAAGGQSRAAQAWSSKEQAKVEQASAAVLEELRQANAAYEAKFGRIYIVCATGKTAEEMLAIAKERMASEPEAELRRAADEQRKITELRLEKLVLS
jgi:allantoicase